MPTGQWGGPTTCSFLPSLQQLLLGGDWLVRRFLIWAQQERAGQLGEVLDLWPTSQLGDGGGKEEGSLQAPTLPSPCCVT